MITLKQTPSLSAPTLKKLAEELVTKLNRTDWKKEDLEVECDVTSHRTVSGWLPDGSVIGEMVDEGFNEVMAHGYWKSFNP